jgi:hypothetical protein
MLVLAIDHSSGVIRSCTGPSNRRTNAADTRCGPAVIATGSVRRSTPSGSELFIQRSTSSSATRAPSTDSSTCSGASAVCSAARPLPYKAPVVSW